MVFLILFERDLDLAPTFFLVGLDLDLDSFEEPTAFLVGDLLFDFPVFAALALVLLGPEDFLLGLL